MSVWSWLKLTVCLWLLRKTVKAAGWLAAVRGGDRGVAADPGHRGRVRRGVVAGLAAGLAAPGRGLVAGPAAGVAGRRGGRARPAAGGRAGPGPGLAARLAVPGGAWPRPGSSCCSPRPRSRPGWPWPPRLWAWRNYAITTGLGGITASAPITFDPGSGNGRSAPPRGLTDAPGAVPLLARGGKIPVGGTIRAVGHRWDPVFTLPAAACARHMVIIGATGSGKTNLMIRLWAGWFTATLDAAHAGKGTGRC